jgi:hypothetical protein
VGSESFLTGDTPSTSSFVSWLDATSSRCNVCRVPRMALSRLSISSFFFWSGLRNWTKQS